MKLRIFQVFFAFDALVCAVILFFALTGSMSSFNIEIWIAILFGLTVIMAGGYWLKQAGHMILGIVLLSVLVIPSILFVVFILLFIVTDTQWR